MRACLLWGRLCCRPTLISYRDLLLILRLCMASPLTTSLQSTHPQLQSLLRLALHCAPQLLHTSMDA